MSAQAERKCEASRSKKPLEGSRGRGGRYRVANPDISGTAQICRLWTPQGTPCGEDIRSVACIGILEVLSWSAPGIISLHETHNHISGALIANGCIQHAVIYGTVGPFGIEVFSNKISPFTVDTIDEFFRFLFTFAAAKEPPDFVFPWSIKEDPQCIGPVL
jgi:hypothetical protein